LSEVSLHRRKTLEQPYALRAAEPEPEDVAAVGPQSGDQHDDEDLEVSPLGEEPRHHQDGLAFQKGPDENGEIAELLQQELWRHSSGRNARFGAKGEISTCQRNIAPFTGGSMKVIFTGGIALCALALYAAEPQQK